MSFSRQMLSPGPHIPGHNIQHSAEAHAVVIDGGLLDLSRTDYRLMMLLLRYAEKHLPFVPFSELIKCFKHPHDNPRRSVSRRINSMREKVWSYGFDIASVRDQGYTLLLEPLNVKFVPSLSQERQIS